MPQVKLDLTHEVIDAVRYLAEHEGISFTDWLARAVGESLANHPTQKLGFTSDGTPITYCQLAETTSDLGRIPVDVENAPAPTGQHRRSLQEHQHDQQDGWQTRIWAIQQAQHQMRQV